MLNTHEKHKPSFAFIEILNSFEGAFNFNYEEIKLNSFLSPQTQIVHFMQCVELGNEISKGVNPLPLGLVKIKDLNDYQNCFFCCQEKDLVFIHEDNKTLSLQTVTEHSTSGSMFSFSLVSQVLAFVNFKIPVLETVKDARELFQKSQFLTSDVFLKVKFASGFEELTVKAFEKVKEIRVALKSLKNNEDFLDEFNTIFKGNLILDFTYTHFLITEDKSMSEVLKQVSELISEKVNNIKTNYICSMTVKEFKDYLTTSKKHLGVEEELMLIIYQYTDNFFVLPYAVYEHVFRKCFEDSIPATFVVDVIPSAEVFDTADVFFNDMKYKEYVMDEELKEIFEKSLNLE